jgi:hypothetical protein
MSANRAIVVFCLDSHIERSLDPGTRPVDVAPLKLDTANRGKGHRKIG